MNCRSIPTMNDLPPAQAKKILQELVLDPQFRALKARLGDFNLFRTLGIHEKEIIHSRTLAWLMNPEESHGLGDLFLKRWMMQVIHHAELPFSILDVEAAKWADFSVQTEWVTPGSKRNRLDVLAILRDTTGADWVIAVEMKVGATQADGQLLAYDAALDIKFPNTRNQLRLFLTREAERPDEESAFVATSFAQVHRALKESLEERRGRLGEGPQSLLNNYLNLLESWFMENNDIEKLARDIYSRHKDALDIILEQRPDEGYTLTELLRKFIETNAKEFGIQVMKSVKGHVYFTIPEWTRPGAFNDGGKNLSFDLNFYEASIPAEILLHLEPSSALSPTLKDALLKLPKENKAFNRQDKKLKDDQKSYRLHRADLKERLRPKPGEEVNPETYAEKVEAQFRGAWEKIRESIVPAVTEVINAHLPPRSSNE